MKRHKEPVDAPTRESDAQVFVLPPDLLEQLGIQLSGITPGNLNNSVVDSSSEDNAEDMPDSADGPSILETANLMKQSVFMSPTFITTTGPETTSEIKVSNIVTESDVSIQEVNNFVDNNFGKINNTNKKDMNYDGGPTYDVKLKSADIVQYQSIKEYEVENGNMVLTNETYEAENNIGLGVLNKTSCIDDHTDEAYASDGSNSNPGTGTDITNNNKEVSSKQQNTSNKIKILSEKIINHSDLSSIHSSKIQKSNACFLIPVNTIVTGKATKHHNDISLQTKIAQVKECVASALEADNKTEKEDVSNHLENITNTDPVVEDSLSLITHPEIESCDTIDDASHKITDNNSYYESGKAVIPLTSEDQLNCLNVSKYEELKLNTKNDATKEIVSNDEQNLSKSKLCIQGVEKPGGIHEKKINAVLKTYQRTNIQKRIPDLPQMIINNTVDSNVLPTDIINLDDINIGGYKNTNKFCICHDFGQLANYESEIDYEHIHFSNNNSVGCNLETIFSIYDDSSHLREFNVTEDIDIVKDDKEATRYNICWLSFISYINNETEELVLEATLTEESTSGQPRRSNRKRKSTASEHVTEKFESMSKKTVKCGVCGYMLSEVEWNKHKDSEHNSLAWKEGQAIDLKNKGLLKKLGTRLKKLGVLKCTFCKTDIKYLTKFIQHIKVCIKRKVDENSTTVKCEILPGDDELEKTRRSSRNINLAVEVSKTSVNNSNVNRVNITSQNKLKLITKTDEQCKQKKTCSSKIKSMETGTKSVEKDHTSKSAKKSVDGVASEPTKKDATLKDVGKLNKRSINSVSCSKPLVKSLDVETAKCSRQSKSEHTDEKNTPSPKSKRNSLELFSTSTEIQDSSNSQEKGTPKINKIDDSSKPTKLKDAIKAEPTKSSSSKSSRKSIEVSTKSIEIKGTSKLEIKGTPKSTRKSKEVTSIKIETSESTRKLMNDEVLPHPNSYLKDVSLKTARKSIDESGQPKQSASENNPYTASKSDRVDDSNNTVKKSVEAVKISVKNIQKLKEIDLFSSPAIAKSTKIDSESKSTKQSKDDTASSKPVSIVPTLPTSKRTRKSLEVEDSNKQSRKSIDSEGNRKAASAAVKCVEPSTKSMSKSVGVDVSSKPLRQYSRKKDSLKTVDVTMPKETKNMDTPSKLKTVSEHTKPNYKKNISDTISSVTENDKNTKSQKTSMLPPEDSLQKSKVVEIEIPLFGAETAVTKPSNIIKVVDSSSNCNTENAITDAIAENSKDSQDEFITVVSIKEEIIPKCGVCNLPVEESQWIEHIAKEHDYLAWREDETPLDLQDDEEIRAHLYAIVKANGGLTCSKCNLTRKYAKSFLTHIRNCKGNDEEQSDMDASTASVDMNTTQDRDDTPLKTNSRSTNRTALLHRSVECGVCSETVLENKWIDHIRMEHKYLAWKKGEPPLDLTDDVAVKLFLKNISKYNGGLICSKCGATRSYVKKWMDHEASCKGIEANESSSMDCNTEDATPTVTTPLIEIELLGATVKCGKCSKEVASKAWIDHIEKEHHYLSWVEGQTPLDENDQEAVSAYLHALVKKRGSLYCVKCGVTRKYPKAFLTHVSACEISGFKREDFYVEVSAQAKPGEYECAVCHETGKLKEWKKHAMSKHYNVAWMAGDIPINLKNPYAVEKYIKEYRTKHNLVCKVCGASRASCYGFYAHILTCGKTEAELEHLMEMCDICNNNYLCIYRNQHKAMHKEQMIKKEKKEQDAIRAEEEIAAKAKAKLTEGEPIGKRRAAEKAKKVMEKYTSNVQDGSHMCLSCHIEFDNEAQLKSHECQGNLEEGSDSDVSVKLEEPEESDDDMEAVDSNVSDEEDDSMRRKRQIESVPKIVLPFKVKDFSYNLSKSFEDFCQLHYTTERLFDKWQSNDFKILSVDESAIYLPSLLESCKLRTLDDEWVTYKRFEAQRKRDITIFTGASIRCMQWVPHRIGTEIQDHYLSVACFRDSDCPRYGKDDLPEHPGMLQFWNMGQFTILPKLEMGLAHDYGTIWAMDWCPSGGRDPSSDTEDSRLGLLAIACSNGGAYILSVPKFHSVTENEPIFFKLKPVAELRLSVDPIEPPFRIRYQATSISWSPQRGHEVVMVGYADGTTALYDLNTESSILKGTEDGVDIFYPFQDALAENSTITGVALCASADLGRVVCGAASSSVTGATMSAWPRGPAVRSHLAASSVSYTPNWPAALLCSDDVLTVKSTNEMEWWGGGRRLGGACAAGACARCGRVCLTAPPFVRILRAHPSYPELKKQIVATMKMMPIARKRKFKLVNDDLGMILEPLTYDDAIKKYGLEFKTIPKKDQNVASKLCDNAEQCAERFPLSDMPAAAFCPTAAHHHRLAVASHAGFLFIIST